MLLSLHEQNVAMTLVVLGIKKRTLYAHRSREQLDHMLESLKKDDIEVARREKIANIYAKEPFFK